MGPTKRTRVQQTHWAIISMLMGFMMTACAENIAVLQLKYSPVLSTPPLNLSADKRPTIFLGPVTDLRGVEGHILDVASSELATITYLSEAPLTAQVRNALSSELNRMGIPLASSTSNADGRLDAEVTQFQVIEGSSMIRPTLVTITMTVKLRGAREDPRPWVTRVEGSGRAVPGGSFFAKSEKTGNAVQKAGSQALSMAVGKLGLNSGFIDALARLSAPPTVVAKKEERPKPAAKPSGPSFPQTPVTVKFRKIAPRPDDVAVIIGNADYKKQGKDIPNVKPAYADAEGMKRYFTQALGVREGNIIDLRDATSAQIVRVFGSKENYKGQLFDWVQAGISRVYVYYSGHGAPAGKGGSAYLIPADADAARIELNGYPLAVLYKNLGKLPAKSVTVVLEACFSGVSQGGSVISSASPVYLKSRSPAVPPNVTVIAAGAANQIASWEKGGSHGLFTKYFLKGMSGEADKNPYGNGDGKVAWAELKAYLKRTLTYFARRYYGRDQVAQIIAAKGK